MARITADRSLSRQSGPLGPPISSPVAPERRPLGLQTEVLALVGLAGKDDQPVGEFSGGQRQRLGIAQAQLMMVTVGTTVVCRLAGAWHFERSEL